MKSQREILHMQNYVLLEQSSFHDDVLWCLFLYESKWNSKSVFVDHLWGLVIIYSSLKILLFNKHGTHSGYFEYTGMVGFMNHLLKSGPHCMQT